MSEKNLSTIRLDKNSELRRARRTKLFFVFLIFLIFVTGGIIGFLRKKDMQINQVTIVGTKALDPAILLATARDYLNGKYFIVIPKTNTLLLSKSDLQTYLLDHVPSIHRATIRFVERNSIEIAVTEKKPRYMWCYEECYFVDDQGVVYEPSPQFTDGVFFTFKGDLIQGNPIKQQLMPRGDFFQLLELKKSLEALTIMTTGIVIESDRVIKVASIQGHSVNKNASIIMSRDGSVQSVIDALDLLLKDKTFMEQLATKGYRLQSIDVRIPDKIYYKFDE